MLFKFDIGVVLLIGIINVIFVFFFVELFDVMGMLMGVVNCVGLFVEGKMNCLNKVLFVDSMVIVVGLVFGMLLIIVYIESVLGV